MVVLLWLKVLREVKVAVVLVRGLMLQANEDVGLRARAELERSARRVKSVRAEDMCVDEEG